MRVRGGGAGVSLRSLLRSLRRKLRLRVSLVGRSLSPVPLRLEGEVGGTGVEVNLGSCELPAPMPCGVLALLVLLVDAYLVTLSRKDLVSLRPSLTLCLPTALPSAAEVRLEGSVKTERRCCLCTRASSFCVRSSHAELSFEMADSLSISCEPAASWRGSETLEAVSSRDSRRLSAASGRTPSSAREPRGVWPP